MAGALFQMVTCAMPAAVTRPPRGLLTRLVHPPTAAPARASAPDLVRATTFRLSPAAEAALAAGDPTTGHDVYGRWDSPTLRAAAATVAALYDAPSAFVCASGMAAIHGALAHFLGAGATIVASDVLYGGTESALAEWVRERGLAVRRFDPRDPTGLERILAGLPPGGRGLVYAETLSNPLVVPTDLTEIAAVARRHHVPFVLDDTFGAGIVVAPLACGVDVVVGSATKYVGGHGDLVAGYVAGPKEAVAAIHRIVVSQGACLDPAAAYLLVRGARTLPLRFERAQATAADLARRARRHPAVRRVHYADGVDVPLPRGFTGGGAVLSVDVGDGEAAARLVEGLDLWMHATSLGGVESLVSIPARSSHAGLSAEERRRRGIGDGLVRLSVGLEDADDLWADLEAGLARVAGGGP
ncbi:MAG: PLP-dependent transferase [Deltaproteobacteria bacterium]|nr:MAG: PLP-dependent transferase [Deltaproteobacteria bacterium]